MNDVHEFAAIQPDEAAILAGVDNYISRTSVKVGVHAVVALGAVDLAVQIAGVGRGLRRRASPLSAQLLDKRLEYLHGNQHAAAPGAVEDANLGDGGIDEGNVADGAGLVGRVTEDAHAVVVYFRKKDAVAILAPVAALIRFEVHGSAAGKTVH
jgi:hypothetical protein